jgi:hypothetical protein
MDAPGLLYLPTSPIKVGKQQGWWLYPFFLFPIGIV